MTDIPKGKYEDECDELVLRLRAAGVILLVLGGPKGTGFSVSAMDPNVIPRIPNFLRDLANKIENAGLWELFEGNVMIFIHKEQELEAVQAHFPADHYVMVDDKLRILTAMKAIWRDRLTTVFPRQGHYATDQIDPRLDRV
jgi:hypothetical protein